MLRYEKFYILCRETYSEGLTRHCHIDGSWREVIDSELVWKIPSEKEAFKFLADNRKYADDDVLFFLKVYEASLKIVEE